MQSISRWQVFDYFEVNPSWFFFSKGHVAYVARTFERKITYRIIRANADECSGIRART